MPPQLAYILWAISFSPLLPKMYRQGKAVRQNVPKLPEATGPKGIAGSDGWPSMKVVFLGESTFAGVGVETHEEGLVGETARQLSDTLQRLIFWQVHAKSGYTARDVKEKLLSKIEYEDPAIIIIGLGGNNIFKLHSPAKWKREITTLIRELREREFNCPILFTNLPPVGEFPAMTDLLKSVFGKMVRLFHRVMLDVALRSEGVYYVGNPILLKDWIGRTEEANSIDDFFSDGIHPSKLTYRLWAEEIVEFIREKKLI